MLLVFQVFFLHDKKVRSFSSLSGRPSGLSVGLKIQSAISGLNFANFDNLKEICTTKSIILNKLSLLKMQN